MSENSSFLKVIRKVFGSRSNTSIYFEPCGSHETNPFPWPVSYIPNPRGSHKTNPFGRILFVAAVVLAFFFSIEAGIFTILLAILVELRHLATILVKKT